MIVEFGDDPQDPVGLVASVRNKSLEMPIIRCVSDQAIIDLGGVRKDVSLALVEGVVPGDYVIVHVGYALQKVDPDEAARTLALFAGGGVPA